MIGKDIVIFIFVFRHTRRWIFPIYGVPRHFVFATRQRYLHYT